MTMIVDAIYENGVLRPLGSLDLAEHQQVRVTVDTSAPSDVPLCNTSDDDPLAGFRINTGLGDLVEHFDDYRLGRRGR